MTIPTDEQHAPTLDAYRTSDDGVLNGGRVLAVWCEHEQRFHQHAAGGLTKGSGDGHYAAGCACPESPHAVIGYVLRERGLLDQLARSKYPAEQGSGAFCPGCGGFAGAMAEARELLHKRLADHHTYQDVHRLNELSMGRLGGSHGLRVFLDELRQRVSALEAAPDSGAA